MKHIALLGLLCFVAVSVGCGSSGVKAPKSYSHEKFGTHLTKELKEVNSQKKISFLAEAVSEITAENKEELKSCGAVLLATTSTIVYGTATPEGLLCIADLGYVKRLDATQSAETK